MSSTSLVQRLKSKGDFFAISLDEPQLLENRESFELENGTQVSVLDSGIIRFTPATTPNKAVVYSCAVHGNETAPIELCDDLVTRALTGQITIVQPLLVIFANLPAIKIGQRFVEENMNRLFSGTHSKGVSVLNDERKRAKRIEEVVTEFFTSYPELSDRHHYDLHTAIRDSKHEKFAVYPYIENQPRSEEACYFLKASGIDTVLLSDKPTTTFSYFSSSQFNAQAFTLELGKVRPFGQNDMSRFSDIKSQLDDIVCTATYQPASCDLNELNIYRVNQTILRETDSFKLHFDDDIPNFTGFSLDEVMASEDSVEHKAEFEGEAIVFPNAKVALGQRALLTLVKCDLQYGVIES
ncbi:succinylglutamate desuccinylase [Alteromonadaceae bacterium M269]|nr:succinylglutamate desuccinylase [Alteromonadaceae bacterium M269]